MAKEKKGSGIQQAAGLIRYFDEESEDAIQISGLCLLCLRGVQHRSLPRERAYSGQQRLEVDVETLGF